MLHKNNEGFRIYTFYFYFFTAFNFLLMVALGQMARNRSTVRCRNVVSCFIALPLLWQWKQWFTCDSTNTDVKWQLSCHLFWLFFFLPQPEASLEARPLGQFCRIKTIVWSESCAWQHISVPSFCGEHLDVTGQNKTRHKGTFRSGFHIGPSCTVGCYHNFFVPSWC